MTLYPMHMKRLTLLAATVFFSASSALAATPNAELTVTTSTPSTASIPRGAQRVTLLELTLSASCSQDVTVSELTVHHEGLGDPEDIQSLYALSTQGIRISRTTRFSGNNRDATLRLSRLTVPACKKATFIIAADFSADAQNGGEHRVSIDAASDITSTANTVSVQPTTSTSIVRTSPSAAGTITVSYPSVHTSVKYGSNRTVGKLKLEADNRSDHVISSITLTNKGRARSTDLQNLVLESTAGEKLSATIKQLNDDLVQFVFTEPFILSKNQSRVLEVHADVRAASKKTIRFIVEEPSDIVSTIAKQRGQRFQ